jgi:hypothetical protein
MFHHVPLMQMCALGPQALRNLQECFDDAWQEVAGNFVAAEADAARSQLASRMLSVAANTELDPKEFVEGSIRLMRENARP